MKPKTLHFVIIPEAAAQTGEAEEEAYFAKLDKLIQLLRSKAKTQSHSSLVLEYMKKSDPHFSADGSPDTPLVSSTGGSNGSSSSGGSNKAVTKLWLPTPGVEASKCITLCTDKRARSDRVFHFDFYWIACDSWLMEELIGTLFIRCKNWGLRMAQTPEYFHAPIMQIHPYRCQPYFQFSNRFERDPMVALSKVAYIQKHCFEAVDSEWIRDADQVTEWVTSAFIDAKKKLSQLLNVDNSSTTTATTPASASTSTSGSTTASAMKKSNSQSALSVAVAAEIAAGNLQSSSSNVTTPVNSSDHATSKVAMSPVNTVNGLQSNDSATRQITNTATAISATTDVLVLSPVKSPKAAVAVVQPSSPALHSESIRTPVSQQQSQMTSQSQLIRGGLSFNLFRGATKKYTGVSTLNIPERKSTGYMPNQSKDSFKTTENKLNFMSKNETQYFHRNGHSCVRFGPNSFVWMFSIGGKISDLSTNVDKEKVLVSEKMRQFFDRCKTVDVCVDILYDLIDSVCGDVRNNLKI